jgi:hypothetical protein
VWVDFVVVVYPIVDGCERGGGIRDGADPDVVALEGPSRTPRRRHCFQQLSTGVKQDSRFTAITMSSVLAAA